MVQVHVTPQLASFTSTPSCRGLPGVCGTPLGGLGWQSGFAKLPYTCGGRNLCPPSAFRCHRAGGFLAVKKLIVLAVLGLGAFAVWRKVQSDRAELDLWTEATAADED